MLECYRCCSLWVWQPVIMWQLWQPVTVWQFSNNLWLNFVTLTTLWQWLWLYDNFMTAFMYDSQWLCDNSVTVYVCVPRMWWLGTTWTMTAGTRSTWGGGPTRWMYRWTKDRSVQVTMATELSFSYPCINVVLYTSDVVFVCFVWCVWKFCNFVCYDETNFYQMAALFERYLNWILYLKKVFKFDDRKVLNGIQFFPSRGKSQNLFWQKHWRGFCYFEASESLLIELSKERTWFGFQQSWLEKLDLIQQKWYSLHIAKHCAVIRLFSLIAKSKCSRNVPDKILCIEFVLKKSLSIF